MVTVLSVLFVSMVMVPSFLLPLWLSHHSCLFPWWPFHLSCSFPWWLFHLSCLFPCPSFLFVSMVVILSLFLFVSVVTVPSFLFVSMVLLHSLLQHGCFCLLQDLDFCRLPSSQLRECNTFFSAAFIYWFLWKQVCATASVNYRTNVRMIKYNLVILYWSLKSKFRCLPLTSHKNK